MNDTRMLSRRRLEDTVEIYELRRRIYVYKLPCGFEFLPKVKDLNNEKGAFTSSSYKSSLLDKIFSSIRHIFAN